MKKYVVTLFIFLSACTVQPPYASFHMEMLTYLYTTTQQLSLYCNNDPEKEISKLLDSLRKNSVWLKNHMFGLGIEGNDNYSIEIWKTIKNFDETYKKQGLVSKYFCKEQSNLSLKIIKKGMDIEALRR